MIIISFLSSLSSLQPLSFRFIAPYSLIIIVEYIYYIYIIYIQINSKCNLLFPSLLLFWVFFRSEHLSLGNSLGGSSLGETHSPSLSSL